VYGQPEKFRRPVTKHATFERRWDVDVLHVVPVNHRI